MIIFTNVFHGLEVCLQTVSFLSDFSLNCLFFRIAYIKRWNEVVGILPILAPVELTMYLLLLQKYYVAVVSSKQSSSKTFEMQEILGTRMLHTICRLISPVWLKKKTGFFWVPNILKEIKDLSNNKRKPSEQDRFVDEETRMKWKYGWR